MKENDHVPCTSIPFRAVLLYSSQSIFFFLNKCSTWEVIVAIVNVKHSFQVLPQISSMIIDGYKMYTKLLATAFTCVNMLPVSL